MQLDNVKISGSMERAQERLVKLDRPANPGGARTILGGEVDQATISDEGRERALMIARLAERAAMDDPERAARVAHARNLVQTHQAASPEALAGAAASLLRAGF